MFEKKANGTSDLRQKEVARELQGSFKGEEKKKSMSFRQRGGESFSRKEGIGKKGRIS